MANDAVTRAILPTGQNYKPIKTKNKMKNQIKLSLSFDEAKLLHNGASQERKKDRLVFECLDWQSVDLMLNDLEDEIYNIIESKV